MSCGRYGKYSARSALVYVPGSGSTSPRDGSVDVEKKGMKMRYQSM